MNISAKFEIHYSQFLDPQGNVVQPLPSFAQNNEHLLKLYRMMTLLRIFDNKAVSLQRTGKMGTYAGIQGQEAISTAIGDAMLPEDLLCPDYREYGAMLQRGSKMEDIFTYWGGDERGSFFGHPQDFPICVPIATQCLHAAGAAYAFKLRQEKRVAVTVLGDGGTSEGDFYEAVNLAGDWNLPLVFVINNNQWAISVPRKLQTGAQTLAQKAIAGGFHGEQVDGNDVIAVRHAMENALQKARRGDGASIIEAITYRLCDHTTADDAKRYRSAAEVEAAWTCEPLLRLRQYLINQNVWSKSQEEQLLKECALEVEGAVQNYINLPPQSPEAIFDYLYQKLPKALEEQRNNLLTGD